MIDDVDNSVRSQLKKAKKQLPAPYGTKYPEPAYTAYEEGLQFQQELEERGGD